MEQRWSGGVNVGDDFSHDVKTRRTGRAGGVLLTKGTYGHRHATPTAYRQKLSEQRTRLFPGQGSLRDMRHAAERVGKHARVLSGEVLLRQS